MTQDQEESLPQDDSEEAGLEHEFSEDDIANAPPVEVIDPEDEEPPPPSRTRPPWLAAALREAGLRVKVVRGWRGRGRPGTFSPRGVMFHHTGSNRNSGAAPCLGIVTHGRSDLPGPLCNLLIGRDSTVFVIAAGRANHAGFGGPWRGIPKDSGNAFTFGVEVENDGIGEPWDREQLRTCARVFAVLLERLGRDHRMLGGHKEWAPDRKPDPARIDMSDFRRRVKRRLR